MAQPREERWHVGKEVPLALIFAFAAQTSLGIWFAATYVAKVDTVISLVAEIRSTQYTQADASRDRELAVERDRELSRRIGVLETKGQK